MARLSFLNALIDVEVHKKQEPGSDIEIRVKQDKRKTNIEVQNYTSGAGWPKTANETWKNRHDLFTFVLLTDPAVESIQGKIKKYEFFQRRDVFVMSEKQLSEMIATIASMVIARSKVETQG